MAAPRKNQASSSETTHDGPIIRRMDAHPARIKYEFSPEDFDVLVRGRSIIDTRLGLSSTPMRTAEDVDQFVRSYGYDLSNPIEKAEILGNFHEAISFIRRFFLQPENSEGLRLEVPRKILEMTDVRELFLMANLSYPGQVEDTQGVQLKNWACSLLKVIHTIAHVDKDLRSSHFSEIQKQIFDRFYKVLHRDDEGALYLGDSPDDPLRVNLLKLETKPKKARESILLKLLHKPEHVAEDIFDRVGLRFITHTRLDALRVVKYLKDKLIVVSANIKPSRSRNTLIDLAALRAQLDPLLRKLDQGEISEQELCDQLEEVARPDLGSQENVHTSSSYRAIQFTCRQLIKLRNPLFDDVRELKNLAKAASLREEVTRVIDRIDLKYLQREMKFFYPFEIQVMDQVSAEENERGRSAHSEYKKAQIQTAMKRVMGSFFDAN